MTRRITSVVVGLGAIALIASTAACSSTRETTTPAATSGGAAGGLIGIAMPTKSSSRWISDGNSMVESFEALGYETDLQYAEDDIPTQVSQIENMVTKGAKVLVIAAIDGVALSDVLQTAADAGVKVIAYDRLIRESANVDYYATFDNFQVGVIQATSIVDELDLTNAAGPFNVELFAGSPDDNNATFFFNGAMSVLQPYIDEGKIVVASGQTDFQQIAILRWDPATAQARMDNLLSSTYASGERVDAVLSPYDGLSRGIISSLKGVGYYTADLAGPVVTGQDAELESVRSILAEEQTSTVFKGRHPGDAGHHQEFPGVKALSERQPGPQAWRDPRHLRRERRRQVDPDEGAVRGPPGTAPTTGRSYFEGHPASSTTSATASATGSSSSTRSWRSSPTSRSPRTSSSATSSASRGCHQLAAGPRRRPRAAGPGGLSEESPTPRSRTSASASSSSSRSPRRCPRTSSCSSSTSPRRPQRERQRSTCSIMDGLRSEGITCIMISHKLNEIEQIADSITIIRDGKTSRPSTCDDRARRPNRIIRAWSAATSSRASRPHPEDRRRASSRSRTGRPAHHPQEGRLVVARTANLHVRARRDRRLRRPHGRRPHRADAMIFGRSYGTKTSGGVDHSRTARTSTPPVGAEGHPRRHRLRHRGPQDPRPEPARRHQAQHGGSPTSARSPTGPGGQTSEEFRSPRLPQGSHQDAERRRRGRQALRRQPAEGRAGQVAVHRP
jgi:putative multiple sugar transport system substrate-binding protein